MNKPYPIDFRQPETIEELSVYMGLDARLLHMLLASDNRGEFYIKHYIEKRSRHRQGRTRMVWTAKHTIYDHAHKAIARRFDLFARLAVPDFPHPSAYGYVKHKSTKDNAKIHCGAPLLLRADIENFFPSISYERLASKFQELGMHEAPAIALAKFVTIDDRLPLGLNASPMLANLICFDLDNQFEKLASDYGCKYTRYADDISISGLSRLPERSEIEQILNKGCFNLSQEKFRVTKNGQAHYVTGLSISDPNTPHVPRHMKRKLRQELYYSKKFGTKNHLAHIGEERIQKGINRLDGTVRYISHVEDKLSAKLKSEWAFLLERDDIQTSYEMLSDSRFICVTCYVDESIVEFNGFKFLALGLVFTENHDAIAASTVATHNEALKDPFYPGNRDAIEKNGLHFVDAHPDLRTKYIEKLLHAPYRAFVAFAKLKADSDYEATYLSILRAALPKRFMWYADACMKMVFEQNSAISQNNIKKTVAEVYQALEQVKNRRPICAPEVSIAPKQEHPCFAAPDFLLALWGRYAQLNDTNPKDKLKRPYRECEPLREHQFERLRDKYRLILNVDTGEEFSRRRPFTPFLT